ncbi:MazG nucleotide pyrophosphohydrolase domain-containing protein [Haladaptatus sp. GCM10025707]|uniref:MazG nucleotide pyrophosphohydrolase domain-containing protein n=1 Tax=Haladaptatus sp. GCM10025707 TaxID=3252658 RepID=UPI00361B71EB
MLDLVAEVGELAGDATESTDYGARPTALSIRDDELGDALFTLLALADALEMDAGAALETSLEKYESRIADTGSPDST